ncbi:MAG: RecQ family ATP-dependent DNA helicase, partial [Flavobacteriaceae bacterium]|nr:RecQ family ATP-dependent DNA helicase [Flavobacteriaceae bacterium]
MNSPKEILKRYWGFDHFKPLQESIINSVLDQQDTFALLPTGGGKSVCYQIPGLISEGICLVISPLISLINDQVNTLKEKDIKAVSLTGAISPEELSVFFDNCKYGNYKFLYLSPERLDSEYVIGRIQDLNVNYIVVDEAHCISQWGNDFRPAYKKIHLLRKHLPNKNIIALTATATLEVQKDIITSLELTSPKIFKKSFKRENISFNIITTENKNELLRIILQKNTQSSIVYVSNRKSTIQLSDFLKSRHITAL